VELVESEKGRAVRKSYDDCPWFLRWTIGRLAVSRECWALSKLKDSVHAPNLLARPNPWTLVTEYIEGTGLEDLPAGQVSGRALLKEAHSLLNDLARYGVVHGDIGHDHWQDMGRESNLIWTDQGRLVSIDFGGALPSRTDTFALGGLVRALSCHDRLLLTKIQYHFQQADLGTAQEEPEQVRWPLEIWDTLHLLGKL